jgi:hypothetical protein
MKKFLVSLLLVLLIVVCVASTSDAIVKITIKNNRNHDLSLAFRWLGLSGFNEEAKRSGWYGVKAGESRTITFEDAEWYLTGGEFGYYATGGGKVWAGKSSDEDPLKVIIHPKGKFDGHPDAPIKGGKVVYFRHVNLKLTNESNPQGPSAATLTFNP